MVRDLTALKLKQSIGLRASTRAVQNYLNLLGWNKRRTGFCQILSPKNSIERVVIRQIMQKI
jgi:hypothetical protein